MKELDEIVEMLGDLEWHTADEIVTKTSLRKEQVVTALDFLANSGLIECEKAFSGENVTLKARITEVGLSFLQLPAEV